MGTISGRHPRDQASWLWQCMVRTTARPVPAARQGVTAVRYWLSDLRVSLSFALENVTTRPQVKLPTLSEVLRALLRLIAGIPRAVVSQVNLVNSAGFLLTAGLLLTLTFSRYGSVMDLAFPSGRPPEAEVSVTDTLFYVSDLAAFLEKAPEHKVSVLAQTGDFQPYRETKVSLQDEVGIVDGSAILRESEEKQPASLNMKSGDKVGKELAVANKMGHDVMTTVAVEVIEDTGLCSGLTGALSMPSTPLCLSSSLRPPCCRSTAGLPSSGPSCLQIA